MDIPLLGFIAQVTLFAFPFCWLLQFIEKRVVGIKSDFWDVFLVSFLSLIGLMLINLSLMIVMGGLNWVFADFIWAVLGFALWFVLVRKILQCETSHSVKISFSMIAVLYALNWALYLMGVELSIVI